MGLKEEIKKILKENICYLSDGDSIDEEKEINDVVELIMKVIENE